MPVDRLQHPVVEPAAVPAAGSGSAAGAAVCVHAQGGGGLELIGRYDSDSDDTAELSPRCPPPRPGGGELDSDSDDEGVIKAYMQVFDVSRQVLGTLRATSQDSLVPARRATFHPAAQVPLGSDVAKALAQGGGCRKRRSSGVDLFDRDGRRLGTGPRSGGRYTPARAAPSAPVATHPARELPHSVARRVGPSHLSWVRPGSVAALSDAHAVGGQSNTWVRPGSVPAVQAATADHQIGALPPIDAHAGLGGSSGAGAGLSPVRAPGKRVCTGDIWGMQPALTPPPTPHLPGACPVQAPPASAPPAPDPAPAPAPPHLEPEQPNLEPELPAARPLREAQLLHAFVFPHIVRGFKVNVHPCVRAGLPVHLHQCVRSGPTHLRCKTPCQVMTS